MERSRTRWWGMRIAAILLGFTPLLIAELILRWFWPIEVVSLYDPYLDGSEQKPLFEKRGDAFFIPATRFRWFAPAEFSAKKPPNTKRIFCLGGSTTQGEPFKPPTAFPAWLKINLELADPSHPIEVINCGGLSYASYRLLPMVVEVLQYEPDLIIVDCGHNEFLESRELSAWRDHHDSSLVQTVARSSRLVRFLSLQFESVSPSNAPSNEPPTRTKMEQDVNALLDNKGGLEKYHRDTLDHESVTKSLRWNIQAMVNVCLAKQVPLILTVPTSNVLDTPPFKIEPRASLDEATRLELLQHWEKAIEETSPPATVLAEMNHVLQLDPEHAGALFWLGKWNHANGNVSEATKLLKLARDMDVCPLRATSDLMNAIKTTSERTATWYLDVNALFESQSKDGLVGNQWLVDHVHPRVEGHQLIGERLAELLLDRKWAQIRELDWTSGRSIAYRKHIAGLGEDYFVRGKQRLEGLQLWTQGRARKGRVEFSPKE